MLFPSFSAHLFDRFIQRCLIDTRIGEGYMRAQMLVGHVCMPLFMVVM